jgi:hypothetical protein
VTDRFPALLGCAVALMLVLVGCGGSSPHRATSSRGAGQGAEVHFTGGRVPGTVYVASGPDELSLDAYRLSGMLTHAQRMTYSPIGLGLDGLAANRNTVVVDRLCCGGLEFVEKLDPSRHGGLPGTVLGAGTDPALSAGGRLARAVSDYRGCGCDALLVRRSLSGADQVVYRIRHPATIVTIAWSPDGRLAVLVGTKGSGGAINRPQILVDPGTARQRRIDPGSSIVLTSGVWFGPRNELSYQTERRVVIYSADGQSRSFLLGMWNATCWLQNDKIFTVSFLNGSLGTLDPRTGAISTLGHFGHSDLFFLDCPAAANAQPVG